MSATTAQLLQAAAEVVGGNAELARRLGIGEKLLSRFLSDSRELPDGLLLRAVDIILADRQARLPASRAARPNPLSSEGEILQNRARGSGATSGGAE
jgi:hypothetical protein